MITEKRSGQLLYLTADTIGVPHAFTTRFGGVSTGHLSSLNLGTGRGDAPDNVLENYRRLGQAIGFAPEDTVLANQVHSCTIRHVMEADRGAGLFQPWLPHCDGLITDVPGIALVVFSADCTPILLWDRATGAVGAVHAGWRGTAKGIAGEAVRQMTEAFGTKPADICAAIGPNIAGCHFETDDDVPEALIASLGEEVRQWIRKDGSKFYPDLKAINTMILQRAGVTQIACSDACTVCQSDRYWSHRVTQGRRGTQGAVIVCREAAL